MDNRIKKFYKDAFDRTNSLSEHAKLRVKESVFSNLHTTVNTVVPISFWEKLRVTFLRSYVLVPLVVLLFITGTTYASADALPGDTLYGVKRQVENARLLISPNKEAKLDLQVNFAEKRLHELEKVRAKNDVKIKMIRKPESDDHTEDIVEDESDNKLNDDSDRNGHGSNETRQDKARDEANNAWKFLEETQKKLEDEGKNEKADDIEKRFKNFRDREEGHDSNDDDHN